MDFESLINSMFSAGESSEDIASKFTETLNRLSSANKRKEEIEVSIVSPELVLPIVKLPFSLNDSISHFFVIYFKFS